MANAEKKERVIHTRVPESLDDEIKRRSVASSAEHLVEDRQCLIELGLR